MLSCLVAAALLASATSPGPVPPPLRDQMDRPDSLAAHAGKPVVAFVVTVKKLRGLRGWEEDLRKRFDAVDYLRIADVPKEPPTTHQRVAEKLRERVPKGIAVSIDVENVWASAFGLDTREMNVLVFDREQRLVARFRGRRDRALIDKVAEAVAPLVGAP